MKINNFQGELTDISAIKEALDIIGSTFQATGQRVTWYVLCGASFLAKVPLRSPRKLFIFIV